MTDPQKTISAKATAKITIPIGMWENPFGPKLSKRIAIIATLHEFEKMAIGIVRRTKDSLCKIDF